MQGKAQRAAMADGIDLGPSIGLSDERIVWWNAAVVTEAVLHQVVVVGGIQRRPQHELVAMLDAKVVLPERAARADLLGHDAVEDLAAAAHVGRRHLDEIEAEARQLIQAILDEYGAGILVTQVETQGVDPPGSVIEAFRDVQAARADKERAINEAQAYYNEVTQKAAGSPRPTRTT